ncbi:MAG: 30S ribosomal protein S3 [Candidatus Paceibacterota bacterium]
MGKKIKPDLIRLGINKPWKARWFFKKESRYFLEEDCLIREVINKSLKRAGIDSIDIERTREDIKVLIKSNKPGLIIGRKGQGIESLRAKMMKGIKALRKEKDINKDFSLKIDVIELRRTELSANVISDQIAYDIEKRVPFRVVMKRTIRNIDQNREVKGAKLQVAGRLNGADIARTESMSIGNMPLSTLRADIDYGQSTASTTYGAVGIKVWLYKGEVFEKED